MGEIRNLGTFNWVDGGELVIEIPRNLNVKKFLISTDGGTVDAGTYDGIGFKQYKFDYKGTQIYNRTYEEIQEEMEAASGVAPAQDVIEVECASGFKGSESNYLRIQCATLAECTTTATTLTLLLYVKIEIADAVSPLKPTDFRHYENWATGTGQRQYRVPMRPGKQRLTRAVIVFKDSGTAEDQDNAIIRVIDLTHGKIWKEMTLKELENLMISRYGYAHNTGYYVLDLNLIVNQVDSWVIETEIVTAQTALVQTVLLETVAA